MAPKGAHGTGREKERKSKSEYLKVGADTGSRVGIWMTEGGALGKEKQLKKVRGEGDSSSLTIVRHCLDRENRCREIEQSRVETNQRVVKTSHGSQANQT